MLIAKWSASSWFAQPATAAFLDGSVYSYSELLFINRLLIAIYRDLKSNIRSVSFGTWYSFNALKITRSVLLF